MKLLFVRHAIAVDRDIYAKLKKKDQDRPLTNSGKSQFEKIAPKILKLIRKPNFIISSPYLRARETAEILAAMTSSATELAQDNILLPDESAINFIKWFNTKFQAHTKGETLVLVGHEPHLSLLLSLLCANSKKPIITLKKGGCALIKFKGPLRAGCATLECLFAPKYFS